VSEKKPKLIQLLTNLPFVFYNIAVDILGMGLGIHQAFFFVYLTYDMNATGFLLGLCAISATASEVPFFFFGDKLLKFIGTEMMVGIAFSAHALRFLWYLIISNAWWALPFEFLHGMIFASVWAASVDYAAAVAPKGLEATAQGIVTAGFTGFGFGVGSFIGGRIYQTFDAYMLFASTIAILMIGFIFFVSTHRPLMTKKMETKNM